MGNSNGKPVVLTDDVNLNHFRLLRVVGKGAFGKDMEYLYIVVDLMNGGDLRFHITRKTFTEEAGIVHRDVKPDNVLLDSEGHVHLADFNVASDLTPGKPLTSKSGTLAYLAPEVYMGRGYGSEVDWWSLGVTFYECIYNKRPFEANNHDALAQSIMKADPAFPVTSPPVTMVCLHAISSLLERDRSVRIGAAGFGTFTDNPFFREFDFEALERKEIEPVFCPSSDKTNFDATYDLEELLLEEAPLEARARKQKPRAELREDATAQEIRADELHRMIETMFEPFNYTQVSAERAPIVANAPNAQNASNSSSASANEPAQKQYAKSEKDVPVDSHHRPQPKETKSIPTPRSRTPGSGSRTRSSTTHSPEGSPPLPATAISTNIAVPANQQPHHRNTYKDPPPHTSPRSPTAAAPQHQQPLPATNTKAASPAQSETPQHRPAPSGPKRQHGSTRSTSQGGGVQVVLNEHGSWSDMANSSQAMVSGPTTSADEQAAAAGSKPPGMLGFLSRKKGRDRSPKAKQRERGVLGKEGARVVISHG
ncbi:hypothetical protein BTJ68_10667 [Hortaea werneckii EXF-2000]|uniref:Protein kinase domain-containing protein n=1 Tax=Hortaea werneckii EXF-2000 TaxID=1157616 RepID=A0A1Z5T038_HORWE|nr:hypothetical protein BTJ68_10667 [Hortaea werneckii EXF-2000]